MTAQEFGWHVVMQAEEPIPPALHVLLAELIASCRNGPLKPPEFGEVWRARHVAPTPWAPLDEPAVAAPKRDATYDDIVKTAQALGLT